MRYTKEYCFQQKEKDKMQCYEELKARGLQEVIDEGNEAYQVIK